MNRERVAITGWSAIAANGIGAEAFAESLRSGQSAVDEVVSFDVEGLSHERAAEAVDFDVKPHLRAPKNFLDRNSELGFAACEMAIRDAGIDLPSPDDLTAGLCTGSASANLATLALFHSTLVTKGPRLVPPFVFPHTYANTTASLLSIEYGLGGPHMAFTSGGAAGAQALVQAARWVAGGRTDLMLAGGMEAFSEPLYRGAALSGWLSPLDGGEERCLPFDENRNGTVLGEGAAMFALESASRAESRGASAAGWIEGGAIAATPGDSMRNALRHANIDPAHVGLVVAAAGGYVELDAIEQQAIAGVFGARPVAVTAPKAIYGETLGASGPLGLAAALAAMTRCASAPTPAPPGIVLVNAAHPDGSAWASLAVTGPRQSG